MSPFDQQRIVLCYPAEAHHLVEIQSAAPGAEVVDAGQERIATEILEADIFCGHAKVPVPWDEVVARGRLRWIHSTAAGLDHCLVPSVVDSSMLVSSSSGLFADQVAEQTLCLLLAQLRNLPTFLRAQQVKQFERLPTDDLHGKTVGIVGFGGNGRRLAEVLSVFRVRLLAVDMFPVDKPAYVERLWDVEQLPRLLAEADIVILCVPLNRQTDRWFDAGVLSQMRPGSYLVNVARGPVVVEDDLVAALRAGHLAGAALDVTQVEPLPADSLLWDLPQVIITPHVGAQAADRNDVATSFFCLNLRRYAAGQRLLNQVDKQLGFPRPEDRAPWRSATWG
jgi:D-3-phosphoglycerate dehydrogenase